MYQQVAPIVFYVKNNNKQTNKQTKNTLFADNKQLYIFVSSICRSTFLGLSKIASICSNLSRSSINSQASFLHSMIISRLDYCNSKGYRPSRLHACRKSRTTLLDLNCHAEKSNREHITPLLKELHWLPVKFRIHYIQDCHLCIPPS